MTGAFLKASVPATIRACEHFSLNFLKLSTFKHHKNKYFQTFMEKSKYKLIEIQTLKMQEEKKKKANNIHYLKTIAKKITILKAYLKISSFR